MEPTSLIDHAEFWLPPEFLTDDDFILEKENNGVGIDDANDFLFPYEFRRGFGSTVKPNVQSLKKEGDEQNYLNELTRQMFQSSLEDDFSGRVCGNHAFLACNDSKAWGMTRSPLCVAGTGCCCRIQRLNQNCQSRTSQAAWDLYCAAAEEAERKNINDEPYDYSNHGGRGLLDPPNNISSVAAAAAVKKQLNNGSDYCNQQPYLPYQSLQAIQFQQLKQQQLMKHHHQLVQQNRGLGVNGNKNGGPMGLLSSSAWSNPLLRRDGSGMMAVFLEDHTGKRGSTGTGVFLPRSVNHTSSAKTRYEKPTLSTVFVPARLAQVLNLNLNEPVRSLASLNDVSWRRRSNNGGFSSHMQGGVRVEQTVNEPRLPSDWAY